MVLILALRPKTWKLERKLGKKTARDASGAVEQSNVGGPSQANNSIADGSLFRTPLPAQDSVIRNADELLDRTDEGGPISPVPLHWLRNTARAKIAILYDYTLAGQVEQVNPES